MRGKGRKKIVKAPESISHEEATELLPWLVNGSLERSKQDLIRDHARFCVVCRRELEALETLRDCVANDMRSEHIPPPDMRSINARIDQLIEKRSWKQKLLGWVQTLTEKPWKLAFVMQTFLVFGLALALMWPSGPEPEFTTLTQPEDLQGTHHIRVVFTSDTTLADVTALLNEMELAVETGPSAQGVYTLAFAEGLSVQDRAQLIGQLQNKPFVQFAQSVVNYNSEH